MVTSGREGLEEEEEEEEENTYISGVV